MKIKAVIFDMDGVLIDSEPYYMYEMMTFLEKHGKPQPPEVVSEVIGSSHQRTWELMAGWLECDYTYDEMYDYYCKTSNVEEVDCTDILNPYVKFLIRYLKKQGVKIAIASSNHLDFIEKVCKENGIEHYFDVIVSGMMFQESKPHPEVYLYTLKKLSLEASETLVIEDSGYGIAAARNAGIKVAAKIDDRFHFDQSKADYHVKDLFDVYQLIKRIEAGEEGFYD
ncbi:HAD superfamily hydrolase (TIGR01509 family) [Breznakia sp. PF5-3]|uniref:HAD family hydrolase n=1 Tax=unclassified Breznakia TaxID=2623764 RepID=UPI002404C75D|nr:MULTISPECIES: HAD family phosphatase [unclassified Breznakia]MDL2276237.1 HAD family phosphatase [Breznakia sp. OttesenSCG-928-G09]MDF9824895.1 HAD superfamily hydrolase (TIGR01509 family) [Breznakia sp. PM6-1]MDF9835606.1 HAD superfamily hydrolase (TIGR01509 family) [Breznakia sp. PF5-3]MDF9837978.1 HAD superfamily hydrolase (TIGR01509 family) [Breznakia sp. PFB2-8]MDF9859967.1 HAD superfamily hydrolase (TIGR01509 family) [Breznakia sp. PH5-24]